MSDALRDALEKAFFAGFDHAGEGFNGEYMRNPDRKEELVGQKFDEWYDKQGANLTLITKDDLRELAEQWEDNSIDAPTSLLEQCAQELREVLEQYE